MSMGAMRFMRALSSVVVLAAAAASAFATPPAQNSNLNSAIIPPTAHYAGLTYGEWLAGLNEWILEVPAADNPILLGNEDKIATDQPRHVWFLANAQPVVDRHFTVPAGKALFASIFSVEVDNFICVDPDTKYTTDELREIAKSIVDSFTDIEVEVDGVPVSDVAAYRSTSPQFASTLPDNNIAQYFGCTDAVPDTYGPMVADGYALLLAPLPVGDHTIHIAGLVIADPSDPSKDVDVDVTWRITVATPHN
jgi:hypothetical protein